MFNLKFYISLLDFYKFDREHYVVGQNENMLCVKVKQYDSNYLSQNTKIKYRNYWADHILQNERQSVTYSKVSDGIIDSMIRGLDNIILACGPHCSGKTFNITGWDNKSEGIVPRLIEEMFTPRDDDGRTVAVAYAMSCVEIKDNRVFDLLSNNWKQPCLMKNVSNLYVCAAETAKRKLWEAHSKRTTVIGEHSDCGTVRSHAYDFIVTLYRHVSAPKDDNYYVTTVSKSSKIHIVELAGVGPNSSKPSRHQIQANRTLLEISRFLGCVANVNVKNNRDSVKDHASSTTLALLKYCQESFSKQRTTLRVMCHIRPELAFLNTNMSVLELGRALRKLPDYVIDVPIMMGPGTVELYKQKEHLTRELYLHKTVKGIRSMAFMTVVQYEWWKNKVLIFLKSKNPGDVVLSKWNYADGFTVLSVFKEYYDRIMYTVDEKSVGVLEFVPFPLKSLPIDKDAIRLTTENTRQTVDKMLAPLDDRSTDTRKYWDEFVALNSPIFSQKEEMSADVRDAHRTCEIYLGIMLDIYEKLIRTRDRMDKLRRKRHLSGHKQYDKNMNEIVPREEISMFQNVKRTDKRMIEANDEFIKKQKHLDSTLFDYSKLKDTIQMRFEEYLNNQSTYEKVEVKTSRIKTVKSMKKPSKFKTPKVNSRKSNDKQT